MVFEKINDPYDEERKREEEFRKEYEKKKLEYQINELKDKIKELREESSKLPENQKDAVLEELGYAENCLKSAEQDLNNNDIDGARFNIEIAQRSIEAASYLLSPNRDNDQSKGMGY
jgi:predicted nuclease with TOPRIM domain